MSSSLLSLILSRYSLSSQKDTFSQVIQTNHSNKSFKQIIHTGQVTEHQIDATFSFPATQTQQDHTHPYNSFVSQWSILSILIVNKTRHDKMRQDEMIDLSENDDKNTSVNDKVIIKQPYFHQKSYFIWQNNTKVLIAQ